MISGPYDLGLTLPGVQHMQAKTSGWRRPGRPREQSDEAEHAEGAARPSGRDQQCQGRQNQQDEGRTVDLRNRPVPAQLQVRKSNQLLAPANARGSDPEACVADISKQSDQHEVQ